MTTVVNCEHHVEEGSRKRSHFCYEDFPVLTEGERTVKRALVTHSPGLFSSHALPSAYYLEANFSHHIISFINISAYNP